MKKATVRIIAAVLAVLVTLTAFPLSAAALDHNASPIDYNGDELGYNTSIINTNDGYIWQNQKKVGTNTANGTIHNNASGATVDVNNGRIGSDVTSHRLYGSAGNGGYVKYNNGIIDGSFSGSTILYNHGSITGTNSGNIDTSFENAYIYKNDGLLGTNKGTVEYNTNFGQLYSNEGIVAGGNTGTIKANAGTIRKNGTDAGFPIGQKGYVEDNRGSGSIDLNTVNGEVWKNTGTVTTNKGYVRNYTGGIVTDNVEGGRVYNYGGAVRSNKGTHYLQVDLTVPNASTVYGEGFSSDNGIDCWLPAGGKGTAVITPDGTYEIKPITVGGGMTSAVKNEDGSWTVTVGGLTSNATAAGLGIETVRLPDSYTVTVITGCGEDIVVEAARGANFFDALDAQGVFDTLWAMDTDEVIFRDLATKPLSDFADEEEFGEDAGALLGMSVISDMTVYACFYQKIKTVCLTLEQPVVGSAVAIDDEYNQTPVPVITLPDDAHCSVSEGSEIWSVEDGDGSVTFSGAFAKGATYYAELLLMPDFGYWLDDDTVVTANGAKVEEAYGRMALYVILSTRAVSPALLGDADGDGEVSILDVTVIQRWLADYSVPDPGIVEKRGDINGGGVDITDVTLIQRYLANYTTAYAIGEKIV